MSDNYENSKDLITITFDGQNWNCQCSGCGQMVPVSNATPLRILEKHKCNICLDGKKPDEWPGWDKPSRTTTRFRNGRRLK